MRTCMLVILVAVIAGCVIAGCVPKPKRAYTVAQIGEIKDLKEVMRVQAHTIDPWFAKEKQTSFSEAEFRDMERAGKVIQAAAVNLRDNIAKSKPKNFGYHANRLEAGASQLLKAAAAKDASGTRAALYAMKRACKSCHSEFK